MQFVFQVSPNELGSNSSPSIKWSRDSKLLALFGNNNSTLIYDRNGNKIATIPVANPNLMDWDSNNQLIAITSSDSHDITLYNFQTNEVNTINAPFVPTWISFSKSRSFLAAGSDKGKFWIWDRQSQQSQTYQGTHCMKIVDGAWNTKKQLVLCSEDHSISVNSIRGETVARYEIDDVPCFPHFVKIDNRFVLIFSSSSKPVVYIWEFNNENKITQIPFSKNLGQITKCLTLNNGYIYIQFSSGRFVLAGFDGKTVVERQVFQSNISKSDANQFKSLVCTGNSMKLIQMGDILNITDEQIRFPSDVSGDTCSCLLSPDGTVGVVGLTNGTVLIYLVEIPILTASRGPYSVYSDSITTLKVYNMHKKKSKKIQVEAQPQRVDICSSKLGVVINNKSWFYNVDDGSLITSTEFTSSIDEIQVNESAFAVLSQSKVILNFFDKSKKTFVYPDFDTNLKVTSYSLTNYLLLIATDDGKIRMFNTQNQQFIEGCQHSCPIISITPNISETRFVFIDPQNDVFLFYPIKLKIVGVTSNNTKIDAKYALFDISDRNVFAVIGSKQVLLYHFTRQNVSGLCLRQLCSVNVNPMKSALGLSNGSLMYLDEQSSEQSLTLPSHCEINKKSEKAVHQLLSLCRYREALKIALKLNDKKLIHKVGEQSILSLNTEIASEAFAQSGDAAKFNIIQPILHENEYSFMRGYVSMMNNDFNTAQKNFLNSTRPQMALDMRAVIRQFDFALKLAENIDPSRIPHLSYENARQNELTGNYVAALKQYKESVKCKEFTRSSRAGIIRCNLLSGKVEHGMQQLMKVHDTKLILECARILERLCVFVSAAQLYARVNEFNSAAKCYIQAGEFKLASELIPKVADQKILRSIGFHLERKGQLEQSTTAFEKAKDWESLVRVLLKVNLNHATEIARNHLQESICRLVAEHCIQLGKFREAIEFMIRSGRSEDAFRIAELHDKMDVLAELIGDNGTVQQYEAIATHFCTKTHIIQAAKFFEMSGDLQRAMNCYMADCSDIAIEAAIELAEKSPDRQLREQLLEYLNVNIKDKTQNLKYLLRMFIIMQQFDEAKEMAMKISDEFRIRGEYKPSHDLLVDIICQFRKHKVPVSSEMWQSLMLIHSYLLVNRHKNDEDKTICALLLKRLSKNVSKFPAHAANLLVMGIVYCGKSKMEKSAHEIAVKVLNSEYKDKVKTVILPKIQKTVRRNYNSEIDEETNPCPGCGANLPISELYCGKCKLILPFDTFTGMHMVKEDWCECPKCKFACSFKLLNEAHICPMCNAEVQNPVQITNLDDFNITAKIKESIIQHF